MRLPFAVQSYTHRSLPVSAQRLINLMAEAQPVTAKAPVVLLPTPGLRFFSAVSRDVCRGVHVMGNDLYAVVGPTVHKVDVNGVATLLGAIAAGGPVSLDSNGEDLCIVVPETQDAYVVNRTSGTITQVTDVDYTGARAVTVIDGYYVFARPDDNEFFLSAINDPLNYNALDFATAEAAPDNLVAPMRVGRDLWLFGERTIEIWNNTGATDFPFLRIAGGFIARGCAAQFSIDTHEGAAVWLGDNRVVYAANGVQPRRISTHAVEQAIAGYSVVSDAVGFVYEQEGHAFYCLTFPTAGDTWVYDFATNMWHERESEGAGGVWRATHAVAFAGGTVAGDVASGNFWLLDPTYGLENAAQIIRTATGTAFHAEGKKVGFSRLTADFAAGAGLASGQGSNPQVWLSWSNDGGHTWGNESARGIGKIGEYRARAEWRRLGQARQRVFRLQWADPVYTSLIAADIEAEAGE